MKFGSHLYGTDTPDSDTDYKGIFLPTARQMLLGKIPKCYSYCTKQGSESKNTKEDTDTEIYSLHYFLDLACSGQTVALDMLHATENMIVESSTIWEDIVAERHRFYTRNLQAFVGYARRQAAKYGIKGSRLNDTKMVIDFLESLDPEMKMFEVWDKLPLGEHVKMAKNPITEQEEYEVCGRKVQMGATIGYCLEVFKKYYSNYGKRAKMAAENQGIDWKAVSHALRAALQTKQILTEKTITFPLKEADYLRRVKQGKFDYLTEVAPRLEAMMDEIEGLSEKSNLPEKVNRKYWENFLVETLRNECF